MHCSTEKLSRPPVGGCRAVSKASDRQPRIGRRPAWATPVLPCFLGPGARVANVEKFVRSSTTMIPWPREPFSRTLRCYDRGRSHLVGRSVARSGTDFGSGRGGHERRRHAQEIVVLPSDNATCCPPGSNVVVGASNNEVLTGNRQCGLHHQLRRSGPNLGRRRSYRATAGKIQSDHRTPPVLLPAWVRTRRPRTADHRQHKASRRRTLPGTAPWLDLGHTNPVHLAEPPERRRPLRRAHCNRSALRPT